MGEIRGWTIRPTTALPAHMMGGIVRSTLAFKLRLGVIRVFIVAHCSKSEPAASNVLSCLSLQAGRFHGTIGSLLIVKFAYFWSLYVRSFVPFHSD